jgi:catechol 2,3-dioxygenase-like lactoylglutathione lyase family enzyme
VTAELNHTIVWCHDKVASAGFLAAMFALPEPQPFLHFLVVRLGNGVSMDYYQKEGEVALQHYAFLVSESEFDGVMDRIAKKGLEYWADPARTQPGEINSHWGGRGVYFMDPSGHLLEAITRPYGAMEDM